MSGSSGSELTATSERELVGDHGDLAESASVVKLGKDEELGEDLTSEKGDQGTIPEGWRYFLQSGTISFMGISLLAFSLTLTIWNTWRAITYVYSPIPEKIGLRCTLHISFCLFAILLVLVGAHWIKPCARGMKVLGNVLGGIGLWELIESLVSYSTDNSPADDLIIYAVALVVCSLIVFALYRWRGINIIDSSLLSPV